MPLLGDVKVVMGRSLGAIDGLSIITVGAVLATVPILAITLVLDITVTLAIRATRAIAGVAAVTLVVTVAVTVAAVVLAGRVVAGAASRARGAATRRGTAGGATLSVGAVEAPRSGRRRASPLDLQDVVATDALVVHVMVRVISIAAILVLDESKESTARAARSGNVTTD